MPALIWRPWVARPVVPPRRRAVGLAVEAWLRLHPSWPLHPKLQGLRWSVRGIAAEAATAEASSVSRLRPRPHSLIAAVLQRSLRRLPGLRGAVSGLAARAERPGHLASTRPSRLTSAHLLYGRCRRPLRHLPVLVPPLQLRGRLVLSLGANEAVARGSVPSVPSRHDRGLLQRTETRVSRLPRSSSSGGARIPTLTTRPKHWARSGWPSLLRHWPSSSRR